MNVLFRTRARLIVFLAGLAFLLTFTTLLTRKTKNAPNPFPEKPSVSAGGSKIEFQEGSPGLEMIKIVEIDRNGNFINVHSPARLIASTAASVSGSDSLVVFESPEIQELYRRYLRSKNVLNYSNKNPKRIRDTFQHKVADKKDLMEPESDVENAPAELAEFEGKLRALGLNPSMLSEARSNVAWIVGDVPESQLHNLKNGTDVELKFSSFPNEVWRGKAEALGDNVDPITRTVKVRITIVNADRKLKPGMYATVKFPESLNSGTIILPAIAAVSVEGKTYVFLEGKPGEFFRREVTLGISNEDVVSVLEGLAKGERVVVDGAILLKGLSFGF